MKKPYNRYKFFLKNWTLNQSTLKTSFWFIRDSENRRTCSVTPRGCSQQNLDCGKLCRTNRVCLSVTKLCLDSLQPHGLQYTRLPCPSLSPGVCWNPCPLSWWCHPTISSSVASFSSCLQSFPASGSFPMNWNLFTNKSQGEKMRQQTGKFLKRWEYQTTWPASWETYMLARKQQLELDMEQQTGFK